MSRHTSCGPGPFLHDESCLDARLENSGDADNVDADALDEIRGFDRFEDGALVMIVEEHSLKSQMPYSTPLPWSGSPPGSWQQLARIKDARLFLIPASEDTSGHATVLNAKLWKDRLSELSGELAAAHRLQAGSGLRGFKNFVRSVRPLSDRFADYDGLRLRR